MCGGGAGASYVVYIHHEFGRVHLIRMCWDSSTVVIHPALSDIYALASKYFEKFHI